jgi:hypothetical protein
MRFNVGCGTKRELTRSALKQYWAASVIALGAWEAYAVSTRRCNTISNTVWVAQRKHPHLTSAGVLLWLIALGKHLLFPEA